MTNVKSKAVAVSALALSAAALLSTGPAQAQWGMGYGWGGGYGYGRPYGYGHPYAYGRSYYARPAYGVPVYGGPVYGGYGDDCRVIIKRRVNQWGDIVVRRIRVCD